MADPFSILLDANVPYSVLAWLTEFRSAWRTTHAADVGLAAASDGTVFAWAQEHGCVIVTFDEDFADRRSFPVETHFGIIRLRVWPTTAEETIAALRRLFD